MYQENVTWATYTITFTDVAKAAAAEASSSLAEIEALARREIDVHVLWPDPPAMDLPKWGFHAFEAKDGPRRTSR